jgi:hypothetical protein
MSKIVDEVIAANKKYASGFGAKKRIWRCHPLVDLPSSPAWMRGWTLRNTQALPKVTHT